MPLKLYIGVSVKIYKHSCITYSIVDGFKLQVVPLMKHLNRFVQLQYVPLTVISR